MFYSIIQEKCRQWLALPDCPVTQLLQYIRRRGALRETQIAAIETYLYLKIAGQGQPLAFLFFRWLFQSVH